MIWFFGDNLGFWREDDSGLSREDSGKVSASATTKLPCATMDYTYVDELPATRDFDVDLSNITDTSCSRVRDSAALPRVCVCGCGKRDDAPVAPHARGARENQYLSDDENLLLWPPNPVDDGSMYGKACTANTDAVFREKDEVEYTFDLVEREPNCGDAGLYPWGLGNLGCVTATTMRLRRPTTRSRSESPTP